MNKTSVNDVKTAVRGMVKNGNLVMTVSENGFGFKEDMEKSPLDFKGIVESWKKEGILNPKRQYTEKEMEDFRKVNDLYRSL